MEAPMKYIHNLLMVLTFTLAFFSGNLQAAPDYTDIKGSIGMTKNQVKEKFGSPDKAMDAINPNSRGTWVYRKVIHPESGKAVSCLLVFSATGVAAVSCS